MASFANYEPGRKIVRGNGGVLTPQLNLNALQLVAYLLRYEKKIFTGDDVWICKTRGGTPVSLADLITIFNNTKNALSFYLYHASALIQSRETDDLKLRAIKSVLLDILSPTITWRLDNTFEIQLLYKFCPNGQPDSSQMANCDSVTVEDGAGDFVVVFNEYTQTNSATAEIRLNGEVPLFAAQEVRITKSNKHFKCLFLVRKDDVVIMAVPMAAADTLCKFKIPNQYALGVYTDKVLKQQEARIGPLVEISPGQVAITSSGQNGGCETVVMDNKDLLYIPTEQDLKIYEEAMEIAAGF